MPSFKTNDKIQLQPNDSIGYDFQVTTCSTSASNDGFIPFDRVVSSVAVSGFAEDNVTPENHMVLSTALLNNIITCVLRYPSGGAGRYRLRFILTLDNGQIKEADFGRIEAQDL